MCYNWIVEARILLPRSTDELSISFDILPEDAYDIAEPGDLLIHNNEFYEITGYTMRNGTPTGFYVTFLECWPC